MTVLNSQLQHRKENSSSVNLSSFPVFCSAVAQLWGPYTEPDLGLQEGTVRHHRFLLRLPGSTWSSVSSPFRMLPNCPFLLGKSWRISAQILGPVMNQGDHLSAARSSQTWWFCCLSVSLSHLDLRKAGPSLWLCSFVVLFPWISHDLAASLGLFPENRASSSLWSPPTSLPSSYLLFLYIFPSLKKLL